MPRTLVQSIRDGERLAGLGVVLGLLSVLCLLIASVGLTLDYRAELRETRQTIYERCLQRQAYDDAAQKARQGQVEFYEALLAISADLPPSPDPAVQAARERQTAAITEVLNDTEGALEQGVTTPCTVYR